MYGNSRYDSGTGFSGFVNDMFILDCCPVDRKQTSSLMGGNIRAQT